MQDDKEEKLSVEDGVDGGLGGAPAVDDACC
jgi:hypothetical protein